MFRKLTSGMMVLVLAAMGIGLTGCDKEEPAGTKLTQEEQIEKSKAEARAGGEASAAGAAAKEEEMREAREKMPIDE